jgi:uncharacterized membrane protein
VLEITAAGMRFVARWEEELAPATVAAIIVPSIPPTWREAARAANSSPAPQAETITSATTTAATARCTQCHVGASAPNGVVLDSLAGMRANAGAIEAMVSAKLMPPGNATGLTDEERAALFAWASAAG